MPNELINVFIVNYNTAQHIQRCIDSVLMQKDVLFDITVVDNHSQDNSAEILHRYANKIKCIMNRENVYFSRANNQMAQHAGGKYFFLLNPDAHFTKPTDLRTLLTFMCAHPQCGLLGVPVHNVNGRVSKPAYRYPGEATFPKKFKNLPGKIAWIVGAAMMVRREAWKTVGGFDKDFRYTGDEVDLCLRLRKANWQIESCHDVAVEHVGAGSFGKVDIAERWKKRQYGLFLFYQKHFTPEEARVLVKCVARRAYRRLLWLRFKRWCWELTDRDIQTFQRQQAVYDAAHEFLLTKTRAFS